MEISNTPADNYMTVLREHGVPKEYSKLFLDLYLLKPRAVILVGSACGHVPRNTISDLDIVLLWHESAIQKAHAYLQRKVVGHSDYSIQYLGPHIQFGYLYIMRHLEQRVIIDFGLASCQFYEYFMPGPHMTIWGDVDTEPLNPAVQRMEVLEQTLWQALKACAAGKNIYALDYLYRAQSLAMLIMSCSENYGGMSRQHYLQEAETRLLKCSFVSDPCRSQITHAILLMAEELSGDAPGMRERLEHWAKAFNIA